MLSLPLKRKGLAIVFIYDVDEVLYRRDLCTVKISFFKFDFK